MSARRASRAAWLVVAVAVLAGPGCAARWAYRQGQSESRKGNWDMAVARYTRALQKDPDNVGYKITLENARIQASRQHYEQARRHLLAEELDKGAEELEIASNYDPSNKSAADDLALVKGRIRRREDERRRMSQMDQEKTVARARVPVPVLSPRSTVPVSLRWDNQGLQKLLETLGKLAGVNVLFDEAFRDKPVSVDLRNVTFQDALDQVTFVNRFFYKVLDPNTIIVVPESAAKRRTYDEVLLRTFYLENSDVKEIEAMLKAALGANVKAVVSNPSLSAINILGTADEIAVAERIIDLNDKSRGEVLVEVEILEVNRSRLKQYGIELANYEVQGTFAPTGAAGEVAGGFTNLRAQVLSSLNLSDFVLAIPSGVVTRFLQTDSTVKILANPRLRAAEGKKTSLQIGQEVPYPVTTFTLPQAGTSSFGPATSFNYRNVGVNLEITPRVNPNGDITMDLTTEFSLIGADRNVGTGQNPLVVPTFSTRKMTGTLRLRDGEKTLLGGLLQTQEKESLKGILGLQSIPVLNRIFTSVNPRQKDETEILMALTPHLVRAPKVTADDLASMYVGTKDLIHVNAVHPPLLGAPEEPAASPAASAAPGPAATPLPSLNRGEPLVGPSPSAPLGSSAGPTSPLGPAGAPSTPLGVPTPTPSPSATIVSAQLSPADLRVAPNGTTSIGLVVMGAQDLTAVELVVRYDPALLEAQEVVPGALLTLDGQPVGVERGIENGRVRARFTRATGTAGSGVVAVMTFRALGAGSGTVTVESLAVTSGGATAAVPAAGARVAVAP